MRNVCKFHEMFVLDAGMWTFWNLHWFDTRFFENSWQFTLVFRNTFSSMTFLPQKILRALTAYNTVMDSKPYWLLQRLIIHQCEEALLMTYQILRSRASFERYFVAAKTTNNALKSTSRKFIAPFNYRPMRNAKAVL